MTPNNYSLLKDPIEFVIASKDSSPTCNFDVYQSKTNQSVGLSGKEAKEFYENLLSSSKTNKKNNQNLKKKSNNKSFVAGLKRRSKDVKPVIPQQKLCVSHASNSTNPPTANDLFKAAEQGVLPDVERIIATRVVDLDATDQYSWTALMMAAHQGHEKVVKYLLIQGAVWEDMVDGSGYDAYDLASLSGHDRIAHMLHHRKSIIKFDAIVTARKAAHQSVKREKLWCDICEMHYAATSHGNELENEHNRSISHQFSLRNKEETPSTSSFFINEQNKGYRMLQSHGWDGSSGLGPSGSGLKYPVKTILKRDRIGLGVKTSTARVTHFAANDQKAVVPVKKVSRTKHKLLNKKKAEKERNIEIDFRRSFY